MWKPASLALAAVAVGALGFGFVHANHEDGHHGHGHDAHTVELAEAKIGSIVVSAPMIRATVPNAPAAGGFVTLMNMGDSDDTLVAARVDASVAGMVQLHTMEMDGDVMRMFEVEGGIPVPAGETVKLVPGGLHIMIMNLTEGLSEGTSHDLTLVFETAGEVTLPFMVLERAMIEKMTGAKGMGHGDHKSHGHGDH